MQAGYRIFTYDLNIYIYNIILYIQHLVYIYILYSEYCVYIYYHIMNNVYIYISLNYE